MRVVLVANSAWYLSNFALPLAQRLAEQGTQLLLLSPDGPQVQALRDAGLRWEPLPLERRGVDPLRELGAVLRLARVLRRERPDLVHGFTLKGAIYGAIAARLAGVRARVLSITGLGYAFADASVRARLLRMVVGGLLRLAAAGSDTRVIVQNPDDAEQVAQAGLVAPEKLRRISGSGVDCQRFRPRAMRPSAQPWTALLVARLLWDKGVAEFVAAARSLRASGSAVRFVVAGAADRGNPAAIPDDRLAAWQAEGQVEWRGQVDDMPGLYASADVVVLPSRREGLPRALTEAAACGLPSIASDAPGCRAVVTDGVEGLLVPVGDATALAAAIARLDADRALAARLGAAARARALREFDSRVVVDAVLAVYREVHPQASGGGA